MIFILFVFLAGLLAMEFIPVSYALMASLGLEKQKEWGVLILSLVFYLSVKPTFSLKNVRLSFQTFPIPFIIAFIFGYFYPPTTAPLYWYLGIIPLAEELLFRGWFYSIVEKVKKNELGENPLPMAVVLSAIAFSVWHLQNYSMGGGLLVFQLMYTFFVGLWLGYIRWKSGSVFLGILFHQALNAAYHFRNIF